MARLMDARGEDWTALQPVAPVANDSRMLGLAEPWHGLRDSALQLCTDLPNLTSLRDAPAGSSLEQQSQRWTTAPSPLPRPSHMSLARPCSTTRSRSR